MPNGSLPLIDISSRPFDDEEVDIKSLIDIFPSFAITATNGHRRNRKGLKKTFNQRRSQSHDAHIVRPLLGKYTGHYTPPYP